VPEEPAGPERSLRGLLDTSVVIALERLGTGDLPDELCVSATTMAELAAGPHAAVARPAELDAP
jgi:predicted nucleic acid-binding protein